MAKTRVCYVVCYRDPNYTRTNSLVNALSLLPDVELCAIKNKHRGLLRYLEVPPKLLAARLRFKPDVFVVGFRAHEIFWAFYPSMAGKRIVFDEFIDHHDWLTSEHSKWFAGWIVWLLDAYMKLVMNLSTFVLTDTKAHAKLAAHNYRVSPTKIIDVPVGADEQVFYPRPSGRHGKNFEVFFYGTALPLHGVPVILEAAKLAAAKNSNLHFTLVGGRGNSAYLKMIDDFRHQNKLEKIIKVEPWVDYAKLPSMIASADLCLGGPFGGTGQAKRVITGKTYQFLAMGRPTVIGKIDEETDLMDRKNCLAVDQASPEQLAEAILWAAANQSILEAIGQAGRQLFVDQFSSAAISKLLQAKVLK